MNVLSDRYASPEMNEIWSRTSKYRLERNLWVKVLKIQSKLGVEIPQQAIDAYEECQDRIDLVAIDAREIATGHDVKARIDEFNSLAGFEHIHLGMTSRDLTENVELLQIRSALHLIEKKAKTLLWILGVKASTFASIPIVARTHNVPAQLTTVGKKFASWAEELKFALDNLGNFLNRLPFKGVHGAVGTNLDLIRLLNEGEIQFQGELSKELDFNDSLVAPTQIYPRSIDFELVSSLFQLIAAPSNIALNIRLLSGLGHASEGLTEGKTGSSAMPHKVNPRLSERINSLTSIARGHIAMISSISGDQWNEGDVSCSALRRVVLPDSFFAVDGILDTAIHLIEQIAIDKESIEAEIHEVLPEIVSSTLLMQSVKKGVGRETAHKHLKEHTQRARVTGESFFELVLNDPTLSLESSDIERVTRDLLSLAGDAPRQAQRMAESIEEYLKAEIEIHSYRPGLIR